VKAEYKEDPVASEEAQEEEPAETLEEENAEAELEEVLAEETAEEKPETAEAEEAPEPAEEEEEAKPRSKRKKEEDEDIVEERTYTIPLGRALVRPPKRRAPRAMYMIRAFITKHMKLTANLGDDDEEKELPTLVISKEVNEKVWSRGIEKPPRKIRVRAAKDSDGNVTVYLAEEN
jgi:large subunit ribosomal protein L31e